VGATNTGLQYLLTKAMIQTATALNVCQYLMIKADLARSALNDEDNGFDDEDMIKNHPVISRLNQLNHLTDKLDSKVESKVNNLNNQFENLVKASSLMQGGDDDNEEGDDISETDMEQVANGNAIDYDAMLQAKEEIHATSDSGDESSSSDEDDEEVATMQKRLMNEARFAHRKQDDEEDDKGGSKRRRRRALPSFSDFGDEDNADEGDLAAAGKSLATTINRISQRSKSGVKVNVAPEVNDEVDEDRFNRGLEMMEAELGGDNNIEGADIDADSIDEDGDDFYSQIQKKSQARKDFKKNMYAVAPKYPGLDNEIEGERAVGNMIMKNRGLVAHKNRLNRNPRVKKREQYRKALIKRKGAVREVRTDEGHKYGGETTGVKSGISRSRKLGVK
jgi:U3 small nucleolar RNA-associated protein 3